jgi:hypothetical protein
MKEQPPRREAFKTLKEYNQAYWDFLCFRYPDIAGTLIGKLVKDSLNNPKKWNDESATIKK